MLQMLIGKMTFRCIQLPNRPVAVAEGGTDDPTSDTQLLPKDQGASADDDEGTTRQLTPSEQDFLADSTPPLQLWGLTLGMTLDFLAHMATYQMQRPARPAKRSVMQAILEHAPSNWLLGKPASTALSRKAPSLVEVFPQFSYPDVNFWIWIFGWRYRMIQRGWERSIGTEMERRTHWSGLALAAF